MKLFVTGILVMLPGVVMAGMPMAEVTDLAKMRLSTISFFLVLLVLSAVVLRWLWNGLVKEFPKLPVLTYRAALGMVVVWGLLFVLVLTMISGARELMTPGAWTKRGATYQLNEQPIAVARHDRLQQIRDALWVYAAAHDQAFPMNAASLPEVDWRSLHASGSPYRYVPGAQADQGRRPVVYEPGLFGRERLVLLSDGSIERWPVAEIHAALEAGR